MEIRLHLILKKKKKKCERGGDKKSIDFEKFAIFEKWVFTENFESENKFTLQKRKIFPNPVKRKFEKCKWKTVLLGLLLHEHYVGTFKNTENPLEITNLKLRAVP